MKRSVIRSWVSRVVFLLVVAVLVVWMSSDAKWRVPDESTEDYRPGADVESVHVSLDSRAPISTVADAEGSSLEVDSDGVVPPRDDLLKVVLQVSSTSGSLIPGCRIEIKGISAPRWKVSEESDLSGKVTFQWPIGHAFLAKVWPSSYDNAVVESFFGTLKQELVYRQCFSTRAMARVEVEDYIEVFYNRIRKHSTLGFLSPARFESLYPAGKAA